MNFTQKKKMVNFHKIIVNWPFNEKIGKSHEFDTDKKMVNFHKIIIVNV